MATEEEKVEREERAARTVATVRNSCESGFTLAETVRMLLKRSFAEFAQQYGVRQEELSMCLLGYPGRDLPKIRKLLARVLGLKLAVMNDLIDTYRNYNTKD